MFSRVAVTFYHIFLVDGDLADASTWSEKQFFDWANEGPLKDVAGLLLQHRFAGDIILGMDLTAVTVFLKLTPKQSAKFCDAMTGLRAGWFSPRPFACLRSHSQSLLVFSHISICF